MIFNIYFGRVFWKEPADQDEGEQSGERYEPVAVVLRVQRQERSQTGNDAGRRRVTHPPV